ncbi:MAG: FkbM family methyltransferase [Lachnospiraceae bacterium]|nr:FkbM family methyltransferase [Lachnospiraceae bacterium]
MQNYDQIQSIIVDVQKIARAMKSKAISVKDIQNVQAISIEINNILYHTPRLRFQREYDLGKEDDYYSYSGEILALVELWEQSLQQRSGNKTDIEFWEIYEYFKYGDADDIYRTVVQHFLSLPEGLRIEYLSLPHRYTFLQKHLDFTENDFSLIAQHVEMMVNSVEKYKWLYEHLADYRSKHILNGIIRYWFDFDVDRLHSLCETIFPDYYDLDILQCGENDVMVDLGAFIGDSVEAYITTYSTYKKIYAYEMTPSAFEIMQNRMGGYSNVILKKNGVGSEKGIMYVNSSDNGLANKLLTEGDTAVEVVTLDEDISEPITVIKMDIEGAEKDAILGAEYHILNEKPRLLISTYHTPGDIFDIPCLINDIRDDYKFYMRFNGHGCLWPCDYVLFAV